MWKNQQGMSLIEVLVALLVLGIGVMGYAALQLNAVRMSDDTYARSQAVAVAQNLIERMRANVSEASGTYLTAGQWTGGLPASYSDACFKATVSSNDICTPAQMAAQDIQQVRLMARDSLPNGVVSAASCDEVTCVTVAWNQTTAANCDQDKINETTGDRDEDSSCVVLEFIP